MSLPQPIDDVAFRQAMAACCGARRFVDLMVADPMTADPMTAGPMIAGPTDAGRPTASAEELRAAADLALDRLQRDDWLEAFSHHPRIGDVASLRERFGARSGDWSHGEQAAAAGADDAVLEALAAANQRYEERFGYIFIVCATGKSAAEMLELLRARLDNDPREELMIAAREQRKITALRLEKWLQEIGHAQPAPST